MLNIHDLERRWLRYKIKHYFPYFIGGTLILLAFAGMMGWFATSAGTSASSQEADNTHKQESMPADHATMQTDRTILEPSMRFVEAFQKNAPVVQTSSAPVLTPKPAITTLPPPKMLQMPDPAQSQSVASASNPDKSLSINRNESKTDIEELQIRFKETSNANLGLFIAKYHYDRGNYAEAYNYALKTNSINSRIDESWILFSKSLVKLGRTEQAKKTLQLYYQQSNSEAAKALLNSIEHGTFK